MEALEFAVNCPTGEDDSYQGCSGRVQFLRIPQSEKNPWRGPVSPGCECARGFTSVLEGGFSWHPKTQRGNSTPPTSYIS